MKSLWETLVDDARGIFRLEYNFDRVFLHLEFRDKSYVLDLVRHCREQFPLVKSMIKAEGYDRVSVIIPEGDDKLYRFEKLFGFHEVKRAGGQILMEQEV